MDQVRIGRSARQREVICVWKQGIKGSDDSIAEPSITCGQIDLQTDPRTPKGVLKGISAARSDGPGSNRLAADSTCLPHALEVPINGTPRDRITQVDVITTLVAAAIQVVRRVLIVAGVISRQLPRPDILALDSETAILQAPARIVIEGLV